MQRDTEEYSREMQGNVEECREMQRDAEEYSREMQGNAEKCKGI